MWSFCVRTFVFLLLLNTSVSAEYKINKEDKKLLTQYKQNYKKAKKNKQYEKAINYLFQIIDLEKKNQQDNNIIASKYNDIARLYKILKKYDKSLSFYQKDLNLTILTEGKDSLYTAISYNSLGKLYKTMKKYDKSLNSFQEALTINQQIFGKNHPFTAIIYSNIASTYGQMGKDTNALSFYQKSLEIQTLEKTSLTLATTHNNMGLIYKTLGNYEKASLLMQKALKISINILGEKHLYVARIYSNMGLIYSEKEQYNKALKFHQKALKIKEELLAKKHPSLSKIYNNIATVYQKLGAYKKALKYYKKALSLATNSLVLNTTYSNIAGLYQDMGEYNKALRYYKKALTLNKAILAKNPNLKATLYNNIAVIYTNNKKYTEALNYYQKTLTLLSKNHPFVADTYNNIGLTYNYIKNHTKSLKYYHKSISLKEKKFTQNNSSLATIYNNVGLVHKSKGAYVEALKYMQKALKMKEKLFDREHPSIVISYESIASVYNAKKNYDKAYFYSNKAFRTFLINRNKNSMILNHKEKKDYLMDNISFIELFFVSGNQYIEKLKRLEKKKIKLQETKENIFNSWLNYKGTLFEYQNILSMVKNNPKTSEKIINTINNLNLLNKKLSNSTNRIEESEIEEKIHKIEIELSKDNDKLKNILKLNDLNRTQISKHLNPHQLYIDFAQGNDNYYLFTIDSQQHITFQQIDENQTKRINKNIKAFRANTQKMADYLQEHKIEEIREKSKKEAREILAKLYDDIIKEYLQKQITGKTHLIISPDGLLNYLPFEALYTQNSYLIENYKINYISSGKEFIRQTKIVSKKPKYEMVLFANADFNAKVKEYIPFQKKNEYEEVMERNDTKEFNSLGINEIVTIQKYYPKSLIFKDKNASIANLMQVPSSKILHLSTHGLFLEDENIINPMRKSILVFAGANKNKQQATISALKLSTLNLKETQLVVLSACQSGHG